MTLLAEADRIQLVRNLRTNANLLAARNFTDIPWTLREAADELEKQAEVIVKLKKKKGKR